MSKRSAKPAFYKAMSAPEFYSEANKSIKFQESENFWIFKAGAKVYKVKKPNHSTSSIDLDQVFCAEIQRAEEFHSPSLETKLLYLNQSGENFSLSETKSGEKSFHVVCQNQIQDRCFVAYMLQKDTLKIQHVQTVAKFLAEFHAKAKETASKDLGAAEDVKAQLDDLVYQSKKHLGVSLTQPMLDMTLRPVLKGLETHKKVLASRSRKGRVREIQGNFHPRKVAITQNQVVSLCRSDDPLKNRFKDIAQDVAAFSTELIFAGHRDLAQAFVEAYLQETKDNDLKVVLPLYQVLQAIRQGLYHSLLRLEENEEENKHLATRYYELMVELARTLT